jgi:hypothetical protein
LTALSDLFIIKSIDLIEIIAKVVVVEGRNGVIGYDKRFERYAGKNQFAEPGDSTVNPRTAGLGK